MAEGADHCCPVNSVKSFLYEDTANFVAKTTTKHNLAIGLSYINLLSIIYVQMYVKLGFEYGIRVILAHRAAQASRCSAMV